MRSQFTVCLACLLMHLFLITRIGIAQYDSRVVSEWNTFLQEVQAANADGLAPLMKKLTSGESVKWPPHLALMAHELIAKRFLELKNSKEAIEAFEELLNSPLPNEAQEAQLFAGVWSRALNALCLAYAENEQLERIMPRLNVIDSYSGRSVSEFILTHVEVAAAKVIAERERLQLDQHQSRTLVEALLSAKHPNKKLKHAVQNYRSQVESR